MNFYFKPEDFELNLPPFSAQQHSAMIANRAQRVLDEYLKACPMVYAFSDQNHNHDIWYLKGDNATLSARLFNIEPIEKECKHEPVVYASQGFHEILLNEARCKNIAAKNSNLKMGG